MKKTINVNIGGTAFILDEEAHQILKDYFDSLRAKFGSSEDTEEVIRDIELRIGELLLSKMGNRQVAGVEEVYFVIAQMGQPEDIAGDPAESAKSEKTESTEFKTQRRLFRDVEDARVAGVISGICHYFGLEDPTWVRLLVVISLFFSFGTTLLIYILLWIVMPEARTSAEKLMMRGEPVNILTIEKEVREAAGRVETTYKTTFNNNHFLGKLGNILTLLLKGVFKLALWIIGTIALFVFVLIAGTLFGAISIASIPFTTVLLPLLGIGGWLKFLLLAGIILLLGAPLLAIIYLVLRMVFNLKNRARYVRRSLFGAWIIGIVMLIMAAINISHYVKSEGVSITEQPILQPADSSSLLVQLNPAGFPAPNEVEEEESEDPEIWDIVINDQSLLTPTGIRIGKPWIKLYPSKSGTYEMKKVAIGAGRTVEEGRKNAQFVNCNYAQTDSILTLDGHYELKKNSPWRKQRMFIYLGVPEGKTIRFADNIDEVPATVKNDDSYDNTLFAGTVWTNRNGKITCLNCKEEISIEEEEKQWNTGEEKEKIIIKKEVKKTLGKVKEELEKAEKELEKEIEIQTK